jgi:osmoprotectant transport system substrate-binding protein
MKKGLVLVVALAILFTLAGCGSDNEVIQIGHKNYTEQRILGQMFAVIIEEETGKETEVTEFGGTNVTHEALKIGEIAIYPEFTGTAYGSILGQSELKDPTAVYDYVKEVYENEFNIIWGTPLGYNNTYTFAVRPEVAEEYNLKTFTDLSKIAPELTMIATAEFLERNDGLPGVVEVYGGFEFKDEVSMDPGLRYTAIEQKEGQVMDAFSTDGKLIEFDLVVLEDDKGFFPPYYVAPILNGEFYEENPKVVEALLQLGDLVSESEMQQMNYEVDTVGTNERTVAENFLREKGLID